MYNISNLLRPSFILLLIFLNPDDQRSPPLNVLIDTVVGSCFRFSSLMSKAPVTDSILSDHCNIANTDNPQLADRYSADQSYALLSSFLPVQIQKREAQKKTPDCAL